MASTSTEPAKIELRLTFNTDKTQSVEQWTAFLRDIEKVAKKYGYKVKAPFK